MMGFLVLLWLPIEDHNFVAATLLAFAICFIGTVSIVAKRKTISRKFSWMGFLGGFCVGPVSFMLMVFKIGLHSHKVPDFTIPQLFQLILIAPVWALSGLLVGYGVHIYSMAKEH
jgi:predicted permease